MFEAAGWAGWIDAVGSGALSPILSGGGSADAVEDIIGVFLPPPIERFKECPDPEDSSGEESSDWIFGPAVWLKLFDLLKRVERKRKSEE